MDVRLHLGIVVISNQTKMSTYSKCKLRRPGAQEGFSPEAFSSDKARVNYANAPNLNDNYLHNAAEHINLAAAAETVGVELYSL
jgi:hypothetical protein